MTAAVTAVGGFVPEFRLTNAMLETMVDTNDEWIKSRTGALPGTDGWDWHINPPFPIPPECGGTAKDFGDAKVKFARAWLRFRASIDDERWERTMARHRNLP